jgi:hypothetical protein
MNMGTVKYNAADGTVSGAYLFDGSDKLGSKAFGITSDNTGAVYVTGETTYKQTGSDVTIIKYEPQVSPAVVSNSEVNDEEPNVKVALRAFPNPARGTSRVSFSIPEDGYVKLSVIDQLGREVRQLHHAKTAAGIHYLVFDTNGLAEGTYIYRLQYHNTIHTEKVIVMR